MPLPFRESAALASRCTAAVAVLCVLALVPRLATPVTASVFAGVATTLALGRSVGSSVRKSYHLIAGAVVGAAIEAATLAALPHVDGALLPLLFVYSFAVVLARPPPLAAKTCIVVLATSLAGVGGKAAPYNPQRSWNIVGATALGSALSVASALVPIASARATARKELGRACALCGSALKAGVREWANAGAEGVDLMKVEWLDEVLRRAEVAGAAFRESLDDAAWELGVGNLQVLRARRKPLEDLFAGLRGLLRVLRRQPFVHSKEYHAAFVQRLRKPLEGLASSADELIRDDATDEKRTRLRDANALFAEEYRAARMAVNYSEDSTEISPPDLLTLNLVFFSATLFSEAALAMHPDPNEAQPAAAGGPPAAPATWLPTLNIRWDDNTKRALRQAAAMFVAGLWTAFGREHTDTTAVLTVGYVVTGASAGASFKTTLQRVEGTAAGVLGPGLLLIAVDGTAVGAALTLLPYVFASMYVWYASEEHPYSGVVSAFTAIGVSLGKSGANTEDIREFVLRRLEDTFIACAAFVLCELTVFPTHADMLLRAALKKTTTAAAEAISHVLDADGFDVNAQQLAQGELQTFVKSLAAAQGYLNDAREEPRLWRPAFRGVRLTRLLTDISGMRIWLELHLRVAQRNGWTPGFTRLVQPLLHPLDVAGEQCSIALSAVGDRSDSAIAIGKALDRLADDVEKAAHDSIEKAIGMASQSKLAPLVESDDVLSFSALAFVIEELLAQVSLCCRDVAALSYQEASLERLNRSIGLSRTGTTFLQKITKKRKFNLVHVAKIAKGFGMSPKPQVAPEVAQAPVDVSPVTPV